MDYPIIDKENLESLESEHAYDIGKAFVKWLYYVTGENYDYTHKICDVVYWGYIDEDNKDLLKVKPTKSTFVAYMTAVLRTVQKDNDGMFGILYDDELFSHVMVKYTSDMKIPRVIRDNGD